MGIPAESRSILGHLFNISMPYSYENPVWALVCGGVESLDEEFNPDDDDIQYICEKTKTVNVSGYGISFDIDIKYIKDSQMQFWVDHKIKTLPTGGKCAFDYIRFNKAEQIFGTQDEFIGVRRRGTVYPNSIGGDAGDPLNCNLSIAGAGDGEIGAVKVETINGHPKFTWITANVEIPFVSSIGGITMPNYYPGVEVSLNNDDEIEVSGSGIGGYTVSAIKSDGQDSATATTTVELATNSWTLNLNPAELAKDNSNIYSVAFRQSKEGVGASVSGQVFKFKLPGTP